MSLDNIHCSFSVLEYKLPGNDVNKTGFRLLNSQIKLRICRQFKTCFNRILILILGNIINFNVYA